MGAHAAASWYRKSCRGFQSFLSNIVCQLLLPIQEAALVHQLKVIALNLHRILAIAPMMGWPAEVSREFALTRSRSCHLSRLEAEWQVSVSLEAPCGSAKVRWNGLTKWVVVA